ncbi:Oxygen-independent coproporphyrinogen-III oxidase [uncultured Clostridium sp.]|nr:Oxygen-independent coproporphyrinogen-III oxidase [uncultured Clostridium sp.]
MFGLYIHIPFCVKKCNYCDFNSFKLDKNLKSTYLEDLRKEMELYKNEVSEEITSIFLGGGTPSILNGGEIKYIFKSIKENFKVSDNAEITIECNPGTLTVDKLRAMRECGINRLSIGLQATQNNHLKYIGRIHSYDEFEKNYKEALKEGFKNINVDLMYCLPNQTFEEWKESLEKITHLNPTHISAYSLILEEGTELYNMHQRKEFKLMDEDTDIDMYEYTINYLNSKGYKQYEISNYAKEGFECEHNILYWKCEHYIGLGPGASGYIKNIRYRNVCDLNEYHKMIEKNEKPIESKEILSKQDSIEEKIFMGLRMNDGIKFNDFKNKFNIDFLEVYKSQLRDLSEKGLISITEESMKLTQRGREISNSIFIEFMN